MGKVQRLLEQSKAALSKGIVAFSFGALLCATTVAHSDQAYSMAPPIDAEVSQPVSTTADTSAQSSVFNWQEVPANQDVPITRAIFDQSGYQLYDNVGETIVVKFKDDNLYVMKFAVSTTGLMYFVNSGTSPILYVPQNGYLENATVPGAKWYPFTQDFHPATPVFLGIAPSWQTYVETGWYPGACFYGGYWGETSFGVFTPSFGLFISFGGHRFHGWEPYRQYCIAEPAPYFIEHYRPENYEYARRHYWGGRTFNGGYGAGHFASGFSGGGHQWGAGATGGHYFRGVAGATEHIGDGNGRFGGVTHTPWQGTVGSSGHRFNGVTHSVGNASQSPVGSGRQFRGIGGGGNFNRGSDAISGGGRVGGAGGRFGGANPGGNSGRFGGGGAPSGGGASSGGGFRGGSGPGGNGGRFGGGSPPAGGGGLGYNGQWRGGNGR